MKAGIIVLLFPMFIVLSNPIAGQNRVASEDFTAFLKAIYVNVNDKSRIIIIQDKEIEALVNKHIAQKLAMKDTGFKGFRIRILSINEQYGKKRVQDELDKFSFYFPDVSAYQIYRAPWWNIYVGDFIFRSQAIRFQKEINTIYKGFIVEMNINYLK